MKHPNKKVEAIRKEYAWALMSRKRKAVKSAFYYWVGDTNQIEKINMTQNDLLTAIASIRQSGIKI
jgi:hypothetical protein